MLELGSEEYATVEDVQEASLDDAEETLAPPTTSTTAGGTGRSPPSSSKIVFLGGIPLTTNREEILGYLSAFGKVRRLILPKVPGSNQLKGYGKAYFSKPSEAEYILQSAPHSIRGFVFGVTKWLDPLLYLENREEENSRKLYVKHKSVHTKKMIYDYFQKFGSILKIDMRLAIESNKPRNFCYIIYKSMQSAEQVADKHHMINGQPVYCEFAKAAKNSEQQGQLVKLLVKRKEDKKRQTGQFRSGNANYCLSDGLNEFSVSHPRGSETSNPKTSGNGMMSSHLRLQTNNNLIKSPSDCDTNIMIDDYKQYDTTSRGLSQFHSANQQVPEECLAGVAETIETFHKYSIKPTSIWYSIDTCNIISQQHKDQENICFRLAREWFN